MSDIEEDEYEYKPLKTVYKNEMKPSTHPQPIKKEGSSRQLHVQSPIEKEIPKITSKVKSIKTTTSNSTSNNKKDKSNTQSVIIKKRKQQEIQVVDDKEPVDTDTDDDVKESETEDDIEVEEVLKEKEKRKKIRNENHKDQTSILLIQNLQQQIEELKQQHQLMKKKKKVVTSTPAPKRQIKEEIIQTHPPVYKSPYIFL